MVVGSLNIKTLVSPPIPPPGPGKVSEPGMSAGRRVRPEQTSCWCGLGCGVYLVRSNINSKQGNLLIKIWIRISSFFDNRLMTHLGWVLDISWTKYNYFLIRIRNSSTSCFCLCINNSFQTSHLMYRNLKDRYQLYAVTLHSALYIVVAFRERVLGSWQVSHILFRISLSLKKILTPGFQPQIHNWF